MPLNLFHERNQLGRRLVHIRRSWREPHEIIHGCVVMLRLKMVPKGKNELFELLDLFFSFGLVMLSSIQFRRGVVLSFLLNQHRLFQCLVFMENFVVFPFESIEGMLQTRLFGFERLDLSCLCIYNLSKIYSSGMRMAACLYSAPLECYTTKAKGKSQGLYFMFRGSRRKYRMVCLSK
jgi:hypothetical protein